MSEPTDHPTEQERDLAERGRALVHAAVAAEHAPLQLREQIERERHRAATQTWRGQLRVILPAAFGAMAILAAIVTIAIVGGTRPPTVPGVALIMLRGHEGPAPAPDPADPSLLKVAVDDITFPSWRGSIGWPASGVRHDTLSGRKVTTVYYRSRSGAEIGYAIVAGKALDEPPGSVIHRRGVRFVVTDDGGRHVVTWRRAGHTCVISAPSRVAVAKLLALVTYRPRT